MRKRCLYWQFRIREYHGRFFEKIFRNINECFNCLLLIQKKIPPMARSVRAGLSQVAIATHKSTTPGAREIGKSRTTRQHSASQSRLEYGFIQTNAPAGGPNNTTPRYIAPVRTISPALPGGGGRRARTGRA